MAMNVHVHIEGQNQSVMTKGCSTIKGREDTSEVYELSQLIEIPWNEQDGRAQGIRLHRPIKILKTMGRDSAMNQIALQTNELLTLTFTFYRHAPTGGQPEAFYTIRLEEANIISYQAELPFTKGADTKDLPPMERLGISFTTITSTYEPEGIVFSDSFHEQGGV